LPKADDLITQQLTNHLNSGRSILFLPTEAPNNETFGGLHWGAWSGDSKPAAVEWWRNDTGLLANTRSGTSLPVGELEVTAAATSSAKARHWPESLKTSRCSCALTFLAMAMLGSSAR
jgi:hypothetical protein